MPDIQDGLDLSPVNAPLGDLSYASGPPNRLSCSLRSMAAMPLAGKVGLERHVVSSPPSPLPAPSPSVWEAVGRSVWQRARQSAQCPANQSLPDVPSLHELLPDEPIWIGSNPAPSGELLDSGLDAEEEPLPLRYGIEPMQDAWSAAFSSSVPAMPDRRVSQPATSPALLQFPRASVRRERAPSIAPRPALVRTDESVLPFRHPARQTIAVFSLAGGTGRTSIAANLARVLAGNGLRVLLADTCGHSVLPCLFGARDVRQGVVRNFLPANGDRNRMISLIGLAVDAFAGDDCGQYRILEEIARDAAHVDRIVWDLGGAPLDWSAKVLCTSSRILVPLLPNTHSLVQLRATERFLNRCHDEDPSPRLKYVLNHFDEREPLHVDIRGKFRQKLGPRMLPVTLRSSPMVDEALSKGRTVIDHAPASPLVGDLWRLAQHLNQIDVRAGFDSLACSRSEWFER